MSDSGPYPAQIGRLLRLESSPTLTMQAAAPRFAVTQTRAPAPTLTEPVSIPCDDAYVVALQLDTYLGNVWVDGRRVSAEPMAAGDVSVYDLRSDTRAEPLTAFNSLQFYLPRASIRTMDGVSRGPSRSLRVPIGIGISDTVVHQLGRALLPAFARPGEASALFLDHLLLAFAAHFSTAYLQDGTEPAFVRGGLSARQLRLAQELLDANIDGHLRLESIARECGLSASYFGRAFAQSTGVPPHRWLTQRRIERSRQLLATSSLSIADIAAACGFADQAHFSRVFATATGASPSRWRRNQLI